MHDRDWLAWRFEENRTHLRTVAWREEPHGTWLPDEIAGAARTAARRRVQGADTPAGRASRSDSPSKPE